MNKLTVIIASLILTCLACNRPGKPATNYQSWKARLNDELSLLGHRNWILVVDKAFPMQNAPGMEILDTNEELIPVLQYTLDKINNSSHVKPMVFIDSELNYIMETQSPGVTDYRSRLKTALGNATAQGLLHDSVFVKMDASSELFKILVLKTNETRAYSSVFIQLDCAYWTAEKEKQLRNSMKESIK